MTPALGSGYVAAATLLTNSLPHLVSGIAGRRHRTPFGPASPAVLNVLWGAANAIGGYLLLRRLDERTHAVAGAPNRLIALTGGGLATALLLAWFFSRDYGLAGAIRE